jgi:hypothetical protein
METGGSHGSSVKTLDATACTGNTQMPLYKSAYANLNDDLQAGSEQKPATRRDDQREGESLCMDTSMVAGHAGEEPVMGDKVILKIRVTIPSLKMIPHFQNFTAAINLMVAMWIFQNRMQKNVPLVITWSKRKVTNYYL